MTSLYVFWQSPESRSWFPVGILRRAREAFEFVYTRGANEAAGFIPFGRMSDLYKRYESRELFPLFSNRVLSAKRPEYNQFLHWIAAEQQADDPFVILSRTGGKRATDSLVLYSKPEPNERNEFDLFFLCHGIEHLPRKASGRVEVLSVDEPLFPMFDVLNPYDRNAVAIRTGDPRHLIGYVPRFFAKELRTCIESATTDEVHFRVARVNLEAPLQFRLLCRFTGPWPSGFEPWAQPEYHALVEDPVRRGALETSIAG
jgi:HIRAN domain